MVSQLEVVAVHRRFVCEGVRKRPHRKFPLVSSSPVKVVVRSQRAAALQFWVEGFVWLVS